MIFAPQHCTAQMNLKAVMTTLEVPELATDDTLPIFPLTAHGIPLNCRRFIA